MKSHRAPVTLALLLAAAWTASAPAQTPASAPAKHDTRDIRHKIADAYGVHAFENVERVSFTFNVAAGERTVRREWTWWPKEGRVRYDGGTWNDGKPLEYNTSERGHDPGKEMTEADERFINDSYWFMFPFHVEWDVAATVTDEGMAPMPIGTGDARKIVVAYPKTGGYTPGDVYELYVSDDYRVLAWVHRPQGSETERHPMTWEDEQRFGDVSFATNHVSPDGKTRLFFTDISVEFAKK